MNELQMLLTCYPKVFQACHRRHVRTGRGKGLSAHQASVLDHMDLEKGMSLLELARHMGVTASSMSLMVDRLEGAGYVRRLRDKADGRRVKLVLTAAGVTVKGEQKVLEPALVKAILERLTPGEREAAVAGVALLARAAEGLVAEDQVRRFRRGG